MGEIYKNIFPHCMQTALDIISFSAQETGTPAPTLLYQMQIHQIQAITSPSPRNLGMTTKQGSRICLLTSEPRNYFSDL